MGFAKEPLVGGEQGLIQLGASEVIRIVAPLIHTADGRAILSAFRAFLFFLGVGRRKTFGI